MKYENTLAGTPHAAPDFDRLAVGDPVILVPEPENKFDPNAIRADSSGGMKLGYVRKQDTGLIRALGLTQLTIVAINPSAKWNEIAVEGEPTSVPA